MSQLFDKYGAILHTDVQVLEKCLSAIASTSKTARVCEIGCHDGGTALGIRAFFQALAIEPEYWGVDPDATRRDFSWGPGCTIIRGDSAEVYGEVPGDLDLVWVDGCHCFNHVVLDTLHFSYKVKVGGFICFHDTNPRAQGHFHQYHGPAIPEFGVAVNAALQAIKFPWPNWKHFDERYDLSHEDCGTVAFRRVS